MSESNKGSQVIFAEMLVFNLNSTPLNHKSSEPYDHVARLFLALQYDQQERFIKYY